MDAALTGAAGLGSTGQERSGDVSSSIKILADNHAVVRNQLNKANKELEEKKKILQALEEEKYLKDGALCIAEQNLRSVNEKLFEVKNRVTRKEKLHEELLKELVEVRWKKQLADKELQTVESHYLDFQVEKAIRQDEVSRVEAEINANRQDAEYEKLKKEIQVYQGYKDRLANGDEELQMIMSGEAVIEIEKRKNAIRDAFNEREARAEMIYVDIDEKNESVERLKQSMHIKEKQNQARLRKLQKQLQDMEETERHLKRTAEYLDRQIDPALNNKSGLKK